MLTAIPVSSRDISGTLVPTFEMRYTKKIVASAVRKAAMGTMGKPKKFIPVPNSIVMPTPTEAPADTPKTYGSAMGFLKTP